MRIVLYRCLVALSAFVINLSASAAEPSRDEQLVRIEQAITSGTAFLVKQQSEDGAWRSRTYGLLKDGTALTPLVTSAIWDNGNGSAARDRALTWMATLLLDERRPDRESKDIQFRVYAAGLCLPILKMHRFDDDDTSDVCRRMAQCHFWVDPIRKLQLNTENGWSPDDVRYGGWGYSHEPPRKPEAGGVLSPLDEPNLSATVFALDGLFACDRTGSKYHSERQAALVFVSRCQNLRPTGVPDDAKFNDGGFHFMQLDPVRNKPGIAGIDSRSETRFVSYGSATADGLRAPLLCGVQPTDRRVIAARKWLIERFNDGSHPGAYPDERSSLKPSLDYYYANSVAQAFQAIPIPADEPLGRAEWAIRLSERLISRQRNDGSWSNPAVDVREDDPLVATPLALRTLQICRDELLAKNVP